ncbi:MAG: hypothetical protein ACOZBH_01850 [Patescibacteria group bacterium]
MLRWLLPIIMSLVTLLTGGLVTWEFNEAPDNEKEMRMIEMVESQMAKSPLRYIIIKYGIEWKTDESAVISGRTVFNMPVVTVQMDKNAIR